MNINKQIRTLEYFEKVYTLHQVGSILRVSRITASRLLWGGKLRGFEVGRAWRIRLGDLQRYMQLQIAAERETTKFVETIGRDEEA